MGILQADLREITRFARRCPFAATEHTARNFAYAAAGMYLWEGVQWILYDIRLQFILVFRLCLFLRETPRVLSKWRHTPSPGPNLISDPTQLNPERGSPSRQPSPTPSSPTVPPVAISFLDTLAQVTYVSLRTCTHLALFSLLAILNQDVPNLGSVAYVNAYASSSESDFTEVATSCNTWYSLSRFSSLVSLLPFAISNMLHALRVSSKEPSSRTRSASSSQSSAAKVTSQYILRMVILSLCMILHFAQYIFIALIGTSRDDDTELLSSQSSRNLLIVAFAYLGLILFRIFCSPVTPADSLGDVGHDDGEIRFSTLPLRSDSDSTRGNALTSGDGSRHSLSEMSFADKSNSFILSEEYETRGSFGFDFKRDFGDYWMQPASHDEIAAVSNEGNNGSHCSSFANTNGHGDRRSPEACRSRNKTAAQWESCASERPNKIESGLESDGNNSSLLREVISRRVGWAYLCIEGGRQGLPWSMSVVLMKIGVLISILFSDTRGYNVNDFFVNDILPTIASGRLFLHITQASPIGTGFLEPSPRPSSPQYPSFIDLTSIEDTRHKRRLSFQTQPNVNSRSVTVPSYVDRMLYARRVRREMDAAAGGAIRTIGGSINLAAPAAALTRPENGRQKTKEPGAARNRGFS
ncbi:uncharacterized protein FOMMEDRAFT_170245 [Fomitiporia mediterranea MF3/22]|uniref:uncharacterized protein n=1 Tax=Fomitiporia mediterranea (strain MF3/22) TaxID=694068 RepID=UPI000440936C|nr:uncharacterized protein FOMMEDRAFT_170245 [Fomitiporia mediterranea MF3/22]EJC99580.1 hypothetical protein FOMMEDRAFT_170245 [Fomitiporia mediterranea MF3/22]